MSPETAETATEPKIIPHAVFQKQAGDNTTSIESH